MYLGNHTNSRFPSSEGLSVKFLTVFTILAGENRRSNSISTVTLGPHGFEVRLNLSAPENALAGGVL